MKEVGRKQRNNIPVGKRVLIFVEGNDDLWLFANHIGENADFSLIHFQTFAETPVGDSQIPNPLRRALSELPRQPGYNQIKALGIIADADTSAESARAHIRSALQGLGYGEVAGSGSWTPMEPHSGIGPVWLGFMVLPPGGECGCLENVLWDSAGEELGHRQPCAEALLKCAEEDRRLRYAERTAQPNHANWRQKVLVHALLAASEEPHLQIGTASRAGFWNFDAPGLKAVLSFLSEGQKRAAV